MKPRTRTILLVTLLLGLVGACFIGDRLLRKKGHAGLSTFLRQWWVNYPASFVVEPEVLDLSVDPKDLDALEQVVRKARERGVIMREGNDYVPAELTAGGSTFKAKVRIKGKMADHVTGEKWSFRVVVRKDKGFRGMQRFSLQHPGTRNYLCDWFYHRLMEGEGLVALRYGFVRLRFNGEDLGVYAYEEHFGPELLAHNMRMKGPLFRFDPGLFWEHRLNMLEKVRYNEPFAAYQAAAVDGFGTEDLEKDPVQRGYFEEAVARMTAFRSGELRASEVFDADKVARRHAILDLVGGHHSMDWSDVKFYYDPVVKRIEPVAYESFSAFHIRTLAGSDRYVGGSDPSMDLHDAYFNDPELFARYVHHLERVSRKEFLDSAFSTLATALDTASAILYREFPYKELDRSIYYKNQLIIRRLLDVPKGFHAYAAPAVDSLRITIVPIEGLPMEVFGAVAADGRLLPPTERTIVPCRKPGTVGRPIEVRIALDEAWRKAAPARVELRYAVLGASTMRTVEVFPYACTDGMALPAFTAPAGYDLRNETMFHVDDAGKLLHIMPGAHTISHDVFIPAGYTVRATAPLRLDLVGGARIVSRSPMDWCGAEDAPISIGSSDAGGGGLVLLSTNAGSRFRHVRFEGFGPSAHGTPAIVLQEAGAEWQHCELAEVRTRDLLLVVRSSVVLNACSFTGGRDQLALAYAQAALSELDLQGAGDDAIAVKGGSVGLRNSAVAAAQGSALVMDEFAEAGVTGGRFASASDVVGVAEGARLELSDARLGPTPAAALDVEGLHARHGPSTVMFKAVEIDATMPLKIGKGNDVSVNGEKIASTAIAP